MTQTTDTEILVFIHAISRCPMCGKKIEAQSKLTEESLVTGNTTQRAAYHAKALRAEVQGEAIRRGWTGEMCGSCRDKSPAERESGHALKRQMDQIRAIKAGATQLPTNGDGS